MVTRFSLEHGNFIRFKPCLNSCMQIGCSAVCSICPNSPNFNVFVICVVVFAHTYTVALVERIVQIIKWKIAVKS